MKNLYPQTYFTQDFSLDYNSVDDAIDEIVRDCKKSNDLNLLTREMQYAIEREQNIGQEFFEQIGVDTIPCESHAEGVEFFRNFLRKSV